VVDDFNSIRFLGQRRGQCCNVDYSRKVWSFNKFFKEIELVDILLVGRKFIWYKQNGTVKSRIDRVLISTNWILKWLDCKKYALGRLVSDYCALIMKVTSIDWGFKTV